jgi:hypothetical protein
LTSDALLPFAVRCREEYVLLQPKFVLPEFFMHVQFPADEILSERSAEGEKMTYIDVDGGVF